MQKLKMNSPLLIKFILITISFSFMQTHAQDLEEYQWKHRILVVKTVDLESNQYQEQLKEFSSQNEEFIERKLILFKLEQDDFSLINFKNEGLSNSGKVSKKLADEILNQKAPFELILIGLDGSIKLQQSKVLTREKLFTTIDEMPMRKNEMRD